LPLALLRGFPNFRHRTPDLNVPAAEKVGGVNAFLEFDLEESYLGQARRMTPCWDVPERPIVESILAGGGKRDKLRQDALSRISPRRKFFEDISGTEHAEVSEVDSGLLNDAQHPIARLTASVMVFQGGGYRRRHVYEGPAGPVGQREAYGPDV